VVGLHGLYSTFWAIWAFIFSRRWQKNKYNFNSNINTCTNTLIVFSDAPCNRFVWILVYTCSYRGRCQLCKMCYRNVGYTYCNRLMQYGIYRKLQHGICGVDRKRTRVCINSKTSVARKLIVSTAVMLMEVVIQHKVGKDNNSNRTVNKNKKKQKKTIS